MKEDGHFVGSAIYTAGTGLAIFWVSTQFGASVGTLIGGPYGALIGTVVGIIAGAILAVISSIIKEDIFS